MPSSGHQDPSRGIKRHTRSISGVHDNKHVTTSHLYCICNISNAACKVHPYHVIRASHCKYI